MAKSDAEGLFFWDEIVDPAPVEPKTELKETADPIEPKEEPKEEPKTEPKEEPKESPKEEPKDTFGQDDPKEEPKDGIDPNKFFTSLGDELHDNFILDLEEGEKLTEENLPDVFKRTVRNRVTEQFADMANALDEEEFKAAKFLLNGGSLSDLLSPSKSLPSFDVSTEDGQRKILEYHIKNVDGITDQDDIDNKLEWYEEDPDRKKKYAEKYYSKVKEAEKLARQSEFDKREQKARERIEQMDALEQKVGTFLKENKELFGAVKVTPRESRSLMSYIFTPSVKTKDGRNVTPFSQDFGEIYLNKPENLIFIAKLMRSGFDLSQIKQKGASDKVKETGEKLQRSLENQKPKGAAGNDGEGPVWKHF